MAYDGGMNPASLAAIPRGVPRGLDQSAAGVRVRRRTRHSGECAEASPRAKRQGPRPCPSPILFRLPCDPFRARPCGVKHTRRMDRERREFESEKDASPARSRQTSHAETLSSPGPRSTGVWRGATQLDPSRGLACARFPGILRRSSTASLPSCLLPKGVAPLRGRVSNSVLRPVE